MLFHPNASPDTFSLTAAFFANSAFIDEKGVTFQKGIFTTCKNREGEKCPPWSIQAKKINHNKAKKTVYYDNAVLKIYDFPIFYFPKVFHPGPTVTRQIGRAHV